MRHTLRLPLLLALLTLAAFPLLAAEAEPADALPEEKSAKRAPHEEAIEVSSRADELVGIADSAGEGVVGRLDLRQRPLLRGGELLETVPGVVITQHTGGGKANQYYLRGFNLDHGTDFRVSVAGMPVNLPTHAHGQGYSDLNFLIPELVDTVAFRKGPYAAADGDFSAAGAVDVDYVRALDAPLVELAGGDFGHGRALAALSRPFGEGTLLAAFEAAHNDGPWEQGDDYRRGNFLARYSAGDATEGWELTALGYGGEWRGTDQVPAQAVADGLVGRFGTLDSSGGGDSRRVSLSASAHRADDRSLRELSAYVLAYDLDLFSNFTYFLDDPEHGDQFEQQDERFAAGGRAARESAFRLLGRDGTLVLGADLRADQIDVGLYHTERRQRLATTRHDVVRQLVGGPYAEARLQWNRWLRGTLGLRVDGFWADVESDLAANSGTASDALLSPKLSLAFGPWAATELYLDAGYGFHSNDARGATLRIDPSTGEPGLRVDPLVRARSLDVGVRTQRLAGLQSTLSIFLLDIDSELVFVGDAGGTDASRPSRRTGIELANHWQPRPWLRLDADVAVSRARFRDDHPAGDHIPGSVERVASAGLALEGSSPFTAGLRLRYFGPRNLVEDGSVRSHGSTLLYAQAGWQVRPGARLSLEVYNLLDAEVSDIDYFYASRATPTAEAREDVHLHPAEPRSLRVVLRLGR